MRDPSFNMIVQRNARRLANRRSLLVFVVFDHSEFQISYRLRYHLFWTVACIAYRFPADVPGHEEGVVKRLP